MAEFREPLLRAFSRLGGKAATADVLAELERAMGSRLTAADHEWLPNGNDVRWRKAAQWQRHRLAQEGLVRSPSHGHWELTERGWEEARKVSH